MVFAGFNSVQSNRMEHRGPERYVFNPYRGNAMLIPLFGKQNIEIKLSLVYLVGVRNTDATSLLSVYFLQASFATHCKSR